MLRVLHLMEAPGAALDASGGLIAALEHPNRPIVFRIANRLFGEKTYPFEPAFLDRVESSFGAGLEPLDFRSQFDASRAHVNRWVEGETEDRIQDLLPPGSITSDTRLVLVNAIYFLGDWAVPFEKESTQPAPFFVSTADRKDVAMMHRTGSFRFARGEAYSALEIPYKGNHMSMLLVLPDATDGLAALERELGASELEALVEALTSLQVRAMVPRFEVNPAASLPLKETLSELGMPLAFDRLRADFTGIASSGIGARRSDPVQGRPPLPLLRPRPRQRSRALHGPRRRPQRRRRLKEPARLLSRSFQRLPAQGKCELEAVVAHSCSRSAGAVTPRSTAQFDGSPRRCSFRNAR
jgi:serpin B